MNIFELMDSKVSSFSKTDKAIYEQIKKFPEEFANSSLNVLCDSGSFTKSAMTRFAQKLGFAGYTEFQYQFQQDISAHKASDQKTSSAEIYGRILRQVSETADHDVISDLIQDMKKARRLFIIGTNLSHVPAEEMMIALSFHSDINAQIPRSDMMPYQYRDDDMILMYSASTGSSHQSLMQALRREGQGKPNMVLITTNAKHPLRHNFRRVIVLPTATMSDSMSNTPLSDMFAFMMFNDLVAEQLQLKKNN